MIHVLNEPTFVYVNTRYAYGITYAMVTPLSSAVYNSPRESFEVITATSLGYPAGPLILDPYRVAHPTMAT